MDPYLLGAIVLAAGFVLISVVMMMTDFSVDKKLDDRLAGEFKNQVREKAKQTNLFQNLGKVAEEMGGERSGFIEGLQTTIDQSGMEGMTPQKLLMMCAGMGLFFSLILFFIFGAMGALIGLVGAVFPLLFVRFKQKQRLEKMRSQLPDTFDLMARIIRAGQTMSQAMQAVADEFVPPISIEFQLCSEMMNLGISPEHALGDLARRSGIIEIKIFVLGLLIQRETGGNLAEMLDNLSATVRERFRINGEIASLTAEGRMQAAVLLCLPPGMLIVMMVLNPTYVSVFFQEPKLILGMLTFEAIGYFFIRRIVNFDY